MTIPVEKLKSLRHIVVHDNCADGTVSAMILKTVLPGADVTFCQYETPLHRDLTAKPDTVFADFSPHPDRVKDFVDVEAVVLDHHASQKGIVAEFGELGVYGDAEADPGACGAVLAFRSVFVPLMFDAHPEMSWLAHPKCVELHRTLSNVAYLAGVRDTWQTKSPAWREACEQAAAALFWPWRMLEGLPPEKWAEKFEIGPVLFQKKLDTAKMLGDSAFRFTSEKGTRVVAFQGSRMTSDVAEYIDKDADLVIGFDVFLQEGEPIMLLSTRSHTTYDCAAFAKTHPGGGGHVRAAGFRWKVKPEDPNAFALIRRIVNMYESKPEYMQLVT